jgi:DNA helicase-2/ATP-dependent DNA helicase PcrA
VPLVDNYRSTPDVTAWVNALATRGRSPLVGRSTRTAPAPRVLAADHERAEEAALVAQIMNWQRDGIALNEIAVLYRYNATTARLESALTAAGIAHHTAGSTRFFERPEIRAILVPFGQRARKDPTADGFGLLAVVARDVSGFDLDAPPEGAGAARQRWEAVNALLALVSEQMAELAAQFVLQDLQRRAVASHDLTPGGVTLATVHAAKGLEWDAVWVAGATEGTFPSSFATTPAELVEERKVFYVALSRARSELVVSWAKRRHNNWSNKPSRFLELLAASRVAKHPVSSRGERSSQRRGAAGECACGARLSSAEARTARACSGGCLTGEARDRFERLVFWRDTQAAAVAVEVEQVASDRALFRAAVRGSSVGVLGFKQVSIPPPL